MLFTQKWGQKGVIFCQKRLLWVDPGQYYVKENDLRKLYFLKVLIIFIFRNFKQRIKNGKIICLSIRIGSTDRMDNPF